MITINVLIAVGLGGIVLFLWTGFTQNVLPWGIKSVQQHTHQDSLGKQLGDVLPSGMLYVKDKVAAFIAIKPETYYSMGRYFTVELLTQLLTAIVITTVLVLASSLSDVQQIGLIALVALAGIVNIDLQYWNWWGFSTIYTVGVALNRLIGYVLTAFILVNWVL